ncbi:MAG: MarR family winged helix-turn-helix transcriptional regulator [Candidatus Saccharimonadales bacterium]
MNSKQQMVVISSGFGLTAMQAMTLLLTEADKPRPMSNFCKLYNCDPSNVTGIVDGLEQKGLVSRHEDPQDRRIKVIRLTSAGKKLQGEITKQLAINNGFLFDSLTHEEAHEFVVIIEKLAAHNRALTCPAK